MEIMHQVLQVTDKKIERMKFRMGEAESRCDCFQISYLQPKNLFCIRDKNFERFRIQNYEQSFDDLRFFCEKFGLNYKDFNISSNTRKSLFPERSLSDKYYTQSEKYFRMNEHYMRTQYDGNDFIFSDKDTFVVLLMLKYKKNDALHSFDDYETSKDTIRFEEESNLFENNDVKVTHNISVIGLRMFYTLNIEYLFYHHFFENFNLEEYKKSDYMNLNTSTSYDPFSKYKNFSKLKQKKANSKTLDDLLSCNGESKYLLNKNGNLEDIPGIKKELFMVLDIHHPQFNFQDEISNSQVLVAGKGIMRVSLYNFLLKDPINPRKKHSIKKQVMCRFEQINVFVPTTPIGTAASAIWCTKQVYEKHSQMNFDSNEPRGDDSMIQIMKIKDL